MTPQHSRPEGAREALEKDVNAAKSKRDQKIAEAEAEFYGTLAQLKSRYRGAQTDIATILGVTRDAILKAIKKHTGGKPTS